MAVTSTSRLLRSRSSPDNHHPPSTHRYRSSLAQRSSPKSPAHRAHGPYPSSVSSSSPSSEPGAPDRTPMHGRPIKKGRNGRGGGFAREHPRPTLTSNGNGSYQHNVFSSDDPTRGQSVYSGASGPTVHNVNLGHAFGFNMPSPYGFQFGQSQGPMSSTHAPVRQSFPPTATPPPQQPNPPSMDDHPPGTNDLEILQKLKKHIIEGQHPLYRAVPQPAALAKLYKGEIPTSILDPSLLEAPKQEDSPAATDPLVPSASLDSVTSGASDTPLKASDGPVDDNRPTNEAHRSASPRSPLDDHDSTTVADKVNAVAGDVAMAPSSPLGQLSPRRSLERTSIGPESPPHDAPMPGLRYPPTSPDSGEASHHTTTITQPDSASGPPLPQSPTTAKASDFPDWKPRDTSPDAMSGLDTTTIVPPPAHIRRAASLESQAQRADDPGVRSSSMLSDDASTKPHRQEWDSPPEFGIEVPSAARADADEYDPMDAYRANPLVLDDRTATALRSLFSPATSHVEPVKGSSEQPPDKAPSAYRPIAVSDRAGYVPEINDQKPRAGPIPASGDTRRPQQMSNAESIGAQPSRDRLGSHPPSQTRSPAVEFSGSGSSKPKDRQHGGPPPGGDSYSGSARYGSSHYRPSGHSPAPSTSSAHPTASDGNRVFRPRRGSFDTRSPRTNSPSAARRDYRVHDRDYKGSSYRPDHHETDPGPSHYDSGRYPSRDHPPTRGYPSSPPSPIPAGRGSYQSDRGAVHRQSWDVGYTQPVRGWDADDASDPYYRPSSWTASRVLSERYRDDRDTAPVPKASSSWSEREVYPPPVDDRDRRDPAARGRPPPGRYPTADYAPTSHRVRPRSPSPIRRSAIPIGNDARPPIKKARDDYSNPGFNNDARQWRPREPVRRSTEDYNPYGPPPSSASSIGTNATGPPPSSASSGGGWPASSGPNAPGGPSMPISSSPHDREFRMRDDYVPSHGGGGGGGGGGYGTYDRPRSPAPGPPRGGDGRGYGPNRSQHGYNRQGYGART